MHDLLLEERRKGASHDHEEAMKAVAATAFGGKITLRQYAIPADPSISWSRYCELHVYLSSNLVPRRPQTSSTLLVFVLAMTLHPEVQTKAQEEVDRVIGHDRLPDFSDRENLPYIECVLLETLRWYPILPLGKHLPSSEEIFLQMGNGAGVPHLTRMDDVFDGMYIPKGNP